MPAGIAKRHAEPGGKVNPQLRAAQSAKILPPKPQFVEVSVCVLQQRGTLPCAITNGVVKSAVSKGFLFS